MERNHPLRYSPSLLYLESSSDGIWRQIIYQKVFVSPRPPPKNSYKDNWMCDLDSDIAGSCKDTQRIQPKPKTQLSSTGRPVCGQESTKEIEKRTLFDHDDVTDSTSTERPVCVSESTERCVLTPIHAEEDQTNTVRPVLVDRKEEHKNEQKESWRVLVDSESRRKLNKLRLDAISFPNYVIKKGPDHDARHGKTKEQTEYHMAWNAWKTCCKKVDSQGEHFTSIHDRFLRDPVYRESQLEIGWTEQKCKEWDELAGEDHTYRLTPEGKRKDIKDNGIVP